MADKHDQWADTLSAEHSGWLTGFLAEEGKVDRRMLWRLGSWGAAAIGAVVVAVLANQSQMQWRRDQLASSDILSRQAEQIQSVARESQADRKRLALAIETLNSDRDRLYARVTSVEQGLDSVTGSIKRQPPATAGAPSAASTAASATSAPKPTPPVTVEPPPVAAVPAPPTPAPAASAPAAPAAPASAAELPSIPTTASPVVAATPPADAQQAKSPAPSTSSGSTPPASPPLIAWKSMMGPPDATIAKLSEPKPPSESAPTPAAPETTASVQTATTEPAPAAPAAEVVPTPVARTEFGVDIGGANSVDGLRAIWRGMSKSRSMNGLRPIIMVKERSTGLGMQLRLVAGPLNDAAAAAKICAGLIESNRPCETSVFDGQRLAVKAEPAPAAAETPPAPAKQSPRSKRVAPKHQERTEQAPPPPPVEEPAPKPQSSLSSFLGMR